MLIFKSDLQLDISRYTHYLFIYLRVYLFRDICFTFHPQTIYFRNKLQTSWATSTSLHSITIPSTISVLNASHITQRIQTTCAVQI